MNRLMFVQTNDWKSPAWIKAEALAEAEEYDCKVVDAPIEVQQAYIEGLEMRLKRAMEFITKTDALEKRRRDDCGR